MDVKGKYLVEPLRAEEIRWASFRAELYKTWLKVADGVVTEFDEAEMERQADAGCQIAVCTRALLAYVRQGGQPVPDAKCEHAPDIDLNDLLVSTFTAPSDIDGGSKFSDRDRGVMVTHLPTGIYARCTKHRYAYENRDEALQEVKALVKAHYEAERK